ncbi:hypothetical protein BpHYR1_009957 [Brachionus plicatilis]|uniref:Uncharacterized protein n=1 Tax=Brachionus plicatilis TaxID=10195 RepID=A0A3M7QJ25_BRAPC|nr:hypothetical protein BpHYR1_009957 [Brachionus plicatilis]
MIQINLHFGYQDIVQTWTFDLFKYLNELWSLACFRTSSDIDKLSSLRLTNINLLKKLKY